MTNDDGRKPEGAPERCFCGVPLAHNFSDQCSRRALI
jgi:hypothetical protein